MRSASGLPPGLWLSNCISRQNTTLLCTPLLPGVLWTTFLGIHNCLASCLFLCCIHRLCDQRSQEGPHCPHMSPASPPRTHSITANWLVLLYARCRSSWTATPSEIRQPPIYCSYCTSLTYLAGGLLFSIKSCYTLLTFILANFVNCSSCVVFAPVEVMKWTTTTSLLLAAFSPAAVSGQVNAASARCSIAVCESTLSYISRYLEY